MQMDTHGGLRAPQRLSHLSHWPSGQMVECHGGSLLRGQGLDRRRQIDSLGNAHGRFLGRLHCRRNRRSLRRPDGVANGDSPNPCAGPVVVADPVPPRHGADERFLRDRFSLLLVTDNRNERPDDGAVLVTEEPLEARSAVAHHPYTVTDNPDRLHRVHRVPRSAMRTRPIAGCLGPGGSRTGNHKRSPPLPPGRRGYRRPALRGGYSLASGDAGGASSHKEVAAHAPMSTRGMARCSTCRPRTTK